MMNEEKRGRGTDPIVVMKFGVKVSSENRSRRDDFPVPVGSKKEKKKTMRDMKG